MKSIDDYKKIVITLKKKVRSLQQEHENLKKMDLQKTYIYADKFTAAQQLKKSANRLGLTPEMLFRAADTTSMEIISTTRLTTILKTITKLHDNYVKELIEMFDIENSESITKDEYYQTLEMYQINEEYGTNYTRNSYAKFIYFLKQEKFDGLLGFLMMDPNKEGFITREMFITFTKNLKNWEEYISLREIHAAFLYLDVSRSDVISKQDYLRAFEKLPAIPDPHKLGEQKINVLRKVLLIKGIRLSTLILELMLQIKQPEYGITIDIFLQVIQNKLNVKDKLILFKLMDLREKGSLDYDGIMVFYYMTMSYGDTFEIVFAILARKLQALNTSIEKYLKREQIYPDTILSFEEFDQLAYELFNVPNSEISFRLFNALDLDNSGTVSAQEIIKFTKESLNNYNLIIRQETKTQQSEMFQDFDSTQIEIANLDFEEQFLFELKIFKQEVTQKDRFEQFQYIFTNEISCLITCLEIVQMMKKNKITSWIDPEFGPNANDPYGSYALYQVENLIPPGWPDPKDLVWIRISDLCFDWMFMDENGANASDVIQSHYLGDCWLISALAIIARNDKFLIDPNNISKGLYPQLFHFLSKYGIFVIKFNKMHRDIYVVIDDRFCTYNNKLLFAECRSENEWWVQIIEKAYAKLHQCYESLTSGDISQALFDLTGIPCSRYHIVHDDADLQPIIVQEEKKKGKNQVPQLQQQINLQTVRERNDKLKRILEDGHSSKSLMGCSALSTGQILINGEETGLYRGHAYGILHFFNFKDTENNNHQLIMIKNPWGFGEWKLKWSDNSKEMEKNLEQIKQYFKEETERCKKVGDEVPDSFSQGEDGIFLMNFKSFRNVFDVLFRSINMNENWSVLRIQDKFQPEHIGSPTKSDRSKALYPYRNPRYTIHINHPFFDKHLYITFQQKDQRLTRLQKYPYEKKMLKVIMCIFRIPAPETELKSFEIEKKVADSKMLSSRRDIDIDVLSVQNGTYVLIPSADKAGIVGEFIISIYFDFPPNGIKVESNTEQQFMLQPKEYNSLLQNQTLMKLFSKL